MNELDMPNDSIQAFLAIDPDWDSDEAAIDAMKPIVLPAVADELRRLAGFMNHAGDRDMLLARADELDEGVAAGQSWGEMDGDS